jgi:hypothetical protein
MISAQMKWSLIFQICLLAISTAITNVLQIDKSGVSVWPWANASPAADDISCVCVCFPVREHNLQMLDHDVRSREK